VEQKFGVYWRGISLSGYQLSFSPKTMCADENSCFKGMHYHHTVQLYIKNVTQILVPELLPKGFYN